MLPGNRHLHPEVEVLGANFSSSLAMVPLDMLCSLEKIMDFQARPSWIGLQSSFFFSQSYYLNDLGNLQNVFQFFNKY